MSVLFKIMELAKQHGAIGPVCYANMIWQGFAFLDVNKHGGIWYLLMRQRPLIT